MNFVMLSLGVALAPSVIVWCTSVGYHQRTEEPKYRFLGLTEEKSNRFFEAIDPTLHIKQTIPTPEFGKAELAGRLE
jgi:hypothetical protein